MICIIPVGLSARLIRDCVACCEESCHRRRGGYEKIDTECAEEA